MVSLGTQPANRKSGFGHSSPTGARAQDLSRQPARPDLWGARVSNDPGLPDRDDPPRPAGRRESSTWISMFPRLGSSRLPKTSRFEAAVPVPMSTRPERVPSR